MCPKGIYSAAQASVTPVGATALSGERLIGPDEGGIDGSVYHRSGVVGSEICGTGTGVGNTYRVAAQGTHRRETPQLSGYFACAAEAQSIVHAVPSR